MSARSDLIFRLQKERDFRASYLRGKLHVLISSQIYALRKRFFGKQTNLAIASGMKQSRISAMEQPGATQFNLETLIRLAATFKVGLVVKFVPFSEMLRWDNRFVQDEFEVIQLDKDLEFLTPTEDLDEDYEEGVSEGNLVFLPSRMASHTEAAFEQVVEAKGDTSVGVAEFEDASSLVGAAGGDHVQDQ